MSFNFNFRYAEDQKDLANLEKFLRQQHLGYPFYDDWVDRVRQELISGYKQGIVAFSDGVLVGNLVFQPHKELPRTLELKNLRVHPNLRMKNFGPFMLRQAEAESRGRYDLVTCDTRADNFPVVKMLLTSGYQEIARAPLYDSHAVDIIFVKDIGMRTAA